MDENVKSSRVIGRQPTLPVELISITGFTSYFRESPLPDFDQYLQTLAIPI
jgi:hypothetical protein